MKSHENQEVKIFSTSDILFASVLLTLNFELQGIDYQIEGTKPNATGYFKFEDTLALSEVQNKYLSGKLAIEPRAFIANFRALKSQVNNKKYKNPHNPIERFNE